MGKKLLPLRRQMMGLLSAFLVCVICITFWCTQSYLEIQKESLSDYLDLYSNHLASTTRDAYTSYENIAYSVAYSTIVQDYIQETDPQKRYKSYQQVYNLLSNSAKLNSNIADIAVIGYGGNSLSLNGSPAIYDCYSDVVEAPANAFLTVGTLAVRKSVCHILAMPVYQLTVSGQNLYLGTVFLAVNCLRFFGNALSSGQGVKSEILFLDEQNRVIVGKDELVDDVQAIEEGQSQELSIGRTAYLASRYGIPETGDSLYILFDTSGYTEASFSVSVRLVTGILAMMALLLACFLMVWYPTSAALRKLTEIMQKISQGEQKTMRQGIELAGVRFGCTEVRDVYRTFNDMLLKINSLNHTIFNTYTQMYDLEMNNRLTEIAFLRSQVNPHFLYNTLTSICGLASAGKNKQIIRVADSLSRIFRYSIQGSDMVELQEELDIIRAYVLIQSCRFENRFKVRYDIQREARTFRIPKMIIQPLVENAIVHGLEPSLHQGTLIISASVTGEQECLEVAVMDTGVGMSEKELSALREEIRESVRDKNARKYFDKLDSETRESIGLFNVNSRIVLYYGEEYRLHVDSWEGAGTSVRLRIPRQPEGSVSDRGSGRHMEKGETKECTRQS